MTSPDEQRADEGTGKMTMEQEEIFDSFYQSTRRPLLRQTFALTGDLEAAQVAVRTAYAGAWQHWRKVSRLDDPLGWVRPRTWQQAQRRHTVGVGHLNPKLSEQHREVLSALSALPVGQRRMLLLVEMAGLDVDAAALELGVTRDAVGRGLRRAVETTAARLDVPADRLGEPLGSLDDLVRATTLPRGPLVRRSGRRRRRSRLLGGAAAVVALALGAGAVAYAYEPGRSGADAALSAAPSGTTSSSPSTDPTATDPTGTDPTGTDPTATAPTADDLLDGRQIRGLGGTRPWRVDRTDNNTSGNGINSVCQLERFADPQGYSAIVRAFHTAGRPRRSAVQTVEMSRSVRQARQGYRTTVGWFAGCRVARLQVLDAYQVDELGDQADVFTLRIWKKPVRTVSVAVARTGAVTTSTVSTTAGAAPSVRQVTRSLADAVTQLCIRSGAGACVGRPTRRAVPPPLSGEPRGVLAVADLPPVGDIDDPWVGTRTHRPAKNPSATTCDRAAFAGGGARVVRARTYLIPQAELPARFGLSETYGVFRSPKAAARFLSNVRGEVAGCEKRDLATQVGAERRVVHRSPQVDLSQWDLTTEVSVREKVRFRLGFVRVDNAVAQLTFAPTDGDDMTEAGFASLVTRAGDRLRQLP